MPFLCLLLRFHRADCVGFLCLFLRLHNVDDFLSLPLMRSQCSRSAVLWLIVLDGELLAIRRAADATDERGDEAGAKRLLRLYGLRAMHPIGLAQRIGTGCACGL